MHERSAPVNAHADDVQDIFPVEAVAPGPDGADRRDQAADPVGGYIRPQQPASDGDAPGLLPRPSAAAYPVSAASTCCRGVAETSSCDAAGVVAAGFAGSPT